MKQSSYTTSVNHPEDVIYLRSALMPINLRLLLSSQDYKELVKHACALVEQCSLMKSEDYDYPYGFSGANAGVPWNIVSLVTNRGTTKAEAIVMINPVITRKSEDTVDANSNCGSVQLTRKIKVKRHTWVDATWYDVEGRRHSLVFSGQLARTLQHEVDHNLGILITDKAIKD